MNTPDEIHRALQALQDPPAPESLWPQVRMRRQRQVRRRRMATALASTGLAAALFVVLLKPETVPQQPPAFQQTAMAPASDDVDPQVRAIDRALQAAYEEGASDAELAPMWEARQALLAQHPAPGRDAGDINDI